MFSSEGGGGGAGERESNSGGGRAYDHREIKREGEAGSCWYCALLPTLTKLHRDWTKFGMMEIRSSDVESGADGFGFFFWRVLKPLLKERSVLPRVTLKCV